MPSAHLEHVSHQAHGSNKDAVAHGGHGRTSKTFGAGGRHLSVTATGLSRLGGISGRGAAAAAVANRALRGIVFGAERLNVVVANVLTLGIAGVGGDALREECLANVEGHGLLVVLNAGGRAVGGASAVPLEG